MAKNPGKIVNTASGKIGIVYNNKPLVNGKVPVYVMDDAMKDLKAGKEHPKPTYSAKPILCKKEDLTIIGFTD